MKTGRTLLLAMVAALALAGVVMLGFLSQARNADEYARILEDARRLRELDANLDGAVLEAHDGLTQSYDELGATLAEMRSVALDLETTAAKLDDPALAAPIARAREVVRAKGDLLDGFESRNSLVRNSLRYLERAARHAATEGGPNADPEIARRCVFVLAGVDSENSHDAASLHELEEAIAALAAARARAPGDDHAAADAVLRHARLYAKETTVLEQAVEALLAEDGRAFDTLSEATEVRRADVMRTANRFRSALLTVALLLLFAVAVVLTRLRQKGRELATLNQHLEVRVVTRTQDLEASREQYRVLLESTQAIPWEMAPGSLRFTYVGPQALRLLGYPLAAWQEDGFLAAHLHPDDVEATLLALLETTATNDHEIELRMLAADGRCLSLRSLVSSLRDARGRPIRRGILLDVTTRRALEAQLGVAQKLESVGRLAAGVAHEINTPVQFVSDNVQFTRTAFATVAQVLGRYGELLRDARLTVTERVAAAREAEEAADLAYLVEEAPRAMEAAVDGLGRIATIVRSLGDFSHPDAPKMTAADLNQSVQSTLVVARSEYKDIADLVLDLGELPPVVCHIGQINQVILNLTVNAAHAIADRLRDGERGRITVSSARDDRHVVIRITDTGNGIPEHVRGRLFDPFFTTKKLGQGTGQGLSIARTIVVDNHGGELTFETERGRGTTFIVRLPVEAAVAHAAAS